jgi:hypothetical protein
MLNSGGVRGDGATTCRSDLCDSAPSSAMARNFRYLTLLQGHLLRQSHETSIIEDFVCHRLPAVEDAGFFARVRESRLCRFELALHNLPILGLSPFGIFPEIPFFESAFVLGLAGLLSTVTRQDRRHIYHLLGP